MLGVRRYELEFLPAAVEILETPASPAGRITTMLLCLFLLIAGVWSYFGQIDIVAVAQGKIVPSGRTKIIQPFETGIVLAIRVEDGQTVKAGDVLVELDPTSTAADRDRLIAEVMTARLDIARLRGAIAAKSPTEKFLPPMGADPAAALVQQSLLSSQLLEQQARLRSLDREKDRQEANAAAISSEIKKHETTLPLIRERVAARESLTEQGMFPRIEFLKLKEELIRAEQDLINALARLTESRAAIASIEQQRAQVAAQFTRDRLTELATAEQKAGSLEQELIKAQQRQGQQQLIAPVDGIVQQLAIHTIGGVVTPAQPLMVIVPESQKLEIEALLLNKDIGFVSAGQEAEIKLEAFPFTKYGFIDGTVSHVSSDAIQDEKQGLVYAARIAMTQSAIKVDGKLVNLSPGMAVTTEIKTGKRRIIEYLLGPVLQYRQESLRER